MQLRAQTEASGRWREQALRRLDVRALRALFAGELAAVRLPRFWAPEACARLARRLRQGGGLSPYRGHGADSPLRKLGPVQCEWADAPATYMEAAARARGLARRSPGDASPVARMVADLREAWDEPVDLAREPRLGAYFAGAVHHMRGVGMELHMDFGPADAPGWSIGEISAQLSWVLCLATPGGGGQTQVYRRPWHRDDEARYRVAGTYYYVDAVVAGCERATLAAVPGDCVLFNSRHYHRRAWRRRQAHHGLLRGADAVGSARGVVLTGPAGPLKRGREPWKRYRAPSCSPSSRITARPRETGALSRAWGAAGARPAVELVPSRHPLKCSTRRPEHRRAHGPLRVHPLDDPPDSPSWCCWGS